MRMQDLHGERQTSRRWAILLAIAAMSVMLLVYGAISAQAQDGGDSPSNGEPPLGDCFGGVFDNDPLHCYVLEKAQKDKAIAIEKIYIEGGVILHIFLEADEVGSDVYAFLKRTSYEFFDQWQDSLPREKYLEALGPCSRINLTFKECWLDRVYGSEFRSKYEMMPITTQYHQLIFQTGGETERRTMPGWASWRQVWPDPKPGGASGGTMTFDVSDVNTGDLPEPGSFLSGHPGPSFYIRHPDLGVAGQSSWGNVMYLQVKTPPRDQAKFDAAKQAVRDHYDEVEASLNEPAEIRAEYIPVPYDYGELWDFAMILNRFALSASNNIGFQSASVRANFGAYGPDTIHLIDRVRGTADGYRDHSTIRATIVVFASKPQVFVDAMPRLLPALGIPSGIIGTVTSSSTDHRQTVQLPDVDIPANDGQPGSEVIFGLEHGSSSGFPVWGIVLGAVGASGLALAAMLYLTLARKRRSLS